MSRPKSARLRMSLFASSSLVGSSLLAGMGGLVVTMAPSAAFAACTPTAAGAPPVTTPAAGTQTCTGTETTGIGYSATAALTVTFNGDTVTGNGVYINDAGAGAAANITINTATGTTNTITNNAGAGAPGIWVQTTKGGAIAVDTGGATVSSTTGDGVFLYPTTGAGAVTYTSTGTVGTSLPNTRTGLWILNAGSGSTTASVNNISDGGIRISGGTGNVTLTSTGSVVNTGAGRAAVDLTAGVGKVSYTADGTISSTNGTAIRAGTASNSTTTLTLGSKSGVTVTGAGTTANPVIALSAVTNGSSTINAGSTVLPASSLVAPAGGVVIGGSASGVTLNATGGGNLFVNLGLIGKGKDASGSGSAVTQLTGTAVLNGHVDYSGLTGNSSTVLVGERNAAGTFTSVWNLAGTGVNGVSTFGAGIDTVENRGVINVAGGSQVTMNFGAGGKGDASPSTGTNTPNGDRFYNRTAGAPSNIINLMTPGTVNIVGANSNLTVTGLELFQNEGSAYLNIRNTTDLSDYVGTNGSTTKASAQSFAMNQGGTYDTLAGAPAAPTFSRFLLTRGTMPVLQSSTGVPGIALPSGGVNLADNDTLDVFAISGQLQGEANSAGSPVGGPRFLVDFDLGKARAADQLWFGDLNGTVTIVPHFKYSAAGAAAPYDPYGIRFATIVSNPATDYSISVDYSSFLDPRDTYQPAPVDGAGDQGLYRAFVDYRHDQGLTALSAGPTNFTSGTKTGGYFLTFLPDTEFWQIANLERAAQDTVREAQGTYFTRQADLRDAVGDSIAGPWIKIIGTSNSFRDERTYPFRPQVNGSTRTIIDRYRSTTVDLTIGADGAATVGKGKVVAGIAAGYSDSDVRFPGSEYGGVHFGQAKEPFHYIPIYADNRTSLEGYHVGGYGSYVQDQFFVDAALSFTTLDQHSIFATLNKNFSTNMKIWNAKVMGGMRFVADDVFSVEPLFGLDFMRTTQDSLTLGADIGASELSFPRVNSVRPGVGGRVKVASATDLYKFNLGLGVMWWHDLNKDGNGLDVTSGTQGATVNSFSITDDAGTRDRAELNVTANMIFANGLSAFVDTTASTDFDAVANVGFSVGGRWRW